MPLGINIEKLVCAGDSMGISEIYYLLLDFGVINTQSEFSGTFLGRSPRYLSYLLATNSEPPAEVFIALTVRLDRLAKEWMKLPQLKCRGEELVKVAARVRADLEHRSIVALPRSRKRHAGPAELVHTPKLKR
jgi:hypothetical protein